MNDQLQLIGTYYEVHSVLLWNHVLTFEDTQLLSWLKKHGKRALVELPNGKVIHAAITRDGDQAFCIKLNVALRKELNIKAEGQMVQVLIKPDQSKYGIAVSNAFENILRREEVFAKYFNALTPGKRRSLIFWVDQPKSDAIKERRAYTLATHLMEQEGVLDFKKLNKLVKQVNASFKKGGSVN